MPSHTAPSRRAPTTAALAWLTCAVTALAMTACGSGTDGAPTRSSVQDLVSRGAVPGAAKLSQDAHGVTGFRAAGVADVRTGRPIQLADHFRAGSLTKTVIATVTLQLVAEHRLGLDDPVADHLPATTAALLRPTVRGADPTDRGAGSTDRDADPTDRGAGPTARAVRPAAGETDTPDKPGITVRQLLNHTSGLFSYTEDDAFFQEFFGEGFAAHRYESHDPGTLVRTALAHPAYAPPGTRYRYSNTDYVLLGMAIRQVTGHSYATEVRRRVILPLHLTGTSFPGTRTNLPTPHGRAYTGTHDVTDLNPSAAGAAGEMITTLPDLNRFIGALLRGALLPPALLRVMRDTASSHGRYGMGLFPVRLPCHRTVWGHNGEINGSYVQALGTADGRRLVSYRANSDARFPAAVEKEFLRTEFCGGDGATGD
ncbi:serine hydrolase [Streptomyces sp. ISL-11]|uniref:serine hydrolase domain-containing protein n=1 Tax=Streptomyces sp. ISL-11 TaxID=2819174 RepID=UPI001BEA857A|nr:serine hydrolase domain-containing protein [Streptomyces sp. ISL-11]MBT2384628.1 beta-lactamase family protein [Streptomyces sp. ISL-11]